MGKYLSFGKYNNHYKYILIYLLFKLINISIYELNFYDVFNGIKIFFFDDSKIQNYAFIRQFIIGYFGTFIFSCIFVVLNKIKTCIENKKRTSANEIILIHEGNKEITDQKNISFLFVLIIIFGWVFEEQAIEKYNTTLCHLDFWMLELLIIAYLNSKILHTEIYKHQKFVLFFSLIPILFKIITIIIELTEEKPRYIYKKHWYWIPLGLLIYFPLITIKAYSIIKIKCFMDLKYITENNLLMIYGFIGTCFYSIFSIISSFADYSNEYIFIEHSNGFKTYFDDFFSSKETKEKLIEILELVSGMITSYIINYNFMMIIKYLTPVHIVLFIAHLTIGIIFLIRLKYPYYIQNLLSMYFKIFFLYLDF